MVQFNVISLVITGAFKGTSRDRIYRELHLESFAERRWSPKIFLFHKIINGLYQYIYSHILVTVMKEFIKQDQQIKRTLHNSLQEQKYLSHPFFLIVLKSGIIFVRSFGKLNQTLSDSKKTQFLRFMT